MQEIIEHVSQTQDDNCMSACLAMLLRKDINVVTEEFHALYVDGAIEATDYLTRHELPHRNCYTHERNLLTNHVYLVGVPSANIKGGMHAILIHVLDDGLVYIYDPNRGREGKTVIVGGHSAGEGEQLLNGYCLEVEISCKDVPRE